MQLKVSQTLHFMLENWAYFLLEGRTWYYRINKLSPKLIIYVMFIIGH